MFRLILILSVLSVAFSGLTLIQRFENWAKAFEIAFENSDHYALVFKKWVDNNNFIELINAQNLSYTLGHNQFSGMDAEEYRVYLSYTNEEKPLRARGYSLGYYAANPPPKSVDWIAAGAVTNVKDQGQCGSCWSFSTTGALEGAYFNKFKKLVSFSEQNLVDCDTLKNGGRDHGCKGGLMDNAFQWIEKNLGLCSESAYPYVSGQTKEAGTCKTTCTNIEGSQIVDFIDVPPSSDNDMMMALTKNPVSVAIQADQREFQLYQSGVFTGMCGANLDHGVLAVGYGNLNGVDYYLVKNSWSYSWGQDGYILLGRGKNPDTGALYNDGAGQCGMLLQGSYPVL